MKNSIGKPCEGKLHARFDEGGTDNPNMLYLHGCNFGRVIRLYSTHSFLRKNFVLKKCV